MLQEELQDDADGDQGGDHVREIEEAETGRDRAEREQGDIREALFGMEAAEDAEVVAVERGGVGHARIAEQEREDRGEGRPHYEQSDDLRGGGAEGALHDESDDRVAALQV